MDLRTASYQELKDFREQLNTRIRELEHETVRKLEQEAAVFGLSLSKMELKPQRRKRRTRAEIEAGLTKPLDLTPKL